MFFSLKWLFLIYLFASSSCNFLILMRFLVCSAILRVRNVYRDMNTRTKYIIIEESLWRPASPPIALVKPPGGFDSSQQQTEAGTKEKDTHTYT